MQQCANCGHQNRAGVVFCENCGASLIGKSSLDTKSLESSTEEEKALMGLDANVIADAKVQGATVFEEGTSLRLDIQGSPDPILFKPKAETIFGRRDPATGAMPDVDLTPFAGYRMGVSRRHAAIRGGENQSLDLWDLGSSNGTFLNSERLNPHRPYRLRDGDEIRLGSMNIRIYFQRDEKAPAKSEAPSPAQQPQKSGNPTDQADEDDSGHPMTTALEADLLRKPEATPESKPKSDVQPKPVAPSSDAQPKSEASPQAPGSDAAKPSNTTPE